MNNDVIGTVLVVEDEPDMAFLIRMFLRQGGYEVVEASHGVIALDRIEEATPDLVVTDLMMPVMSGRELIARLRSDTARATIPILAISANPNGAAEADAVLRKPFGSKELLERVRTLIGDGS